jgi:hypothetical protein
MTPSPDSSLDEIEDFLLESEETLDERQDLLLRIHSHIHWLVHSEIHPN